MSHRTLQTFSIHCGVYRPEIFLDINHLRRVDRLRVFEILHHRYKEECQKQIWSYYLFGFSPADRLILRLEKVAGRTDINDIFHALRTSFFPGYFKR